MAAQSVRPLKRSDTADRILALQRFNASTIQRINLSVVRWKCDPYAIAREHPQPKASGGVNRGVAYWSHGRQARILLGVADGRLISLDAATGCPDAAFGRSGTVDLREGMEGDLNGVHY